MLIVSDFHDYYDVGMKLGIDKTVVYDRKTIAIEGTFLSTERHQISGWKPSVLAFCGKFYPFVYHFTHSEVDRIIWDVEEALEALPRSRWSFSWDEDRIDTDTGIKRFFDRKYPQLEKIFHERKTPIFGFAPASTRTYSWRPKEEPYKSLVINPNLKNIQFYKVKDTYSTFQDIYMFISGVIGIDKQPTTKISDKVMAASKGHDGEYSFRKPPGKRGKKRWR